jgi:4-hydroxy-tetrahydrodipicolinate synthase
VGLKDATGDLTRLPRLRSLCGPDFALYSGDDATGCEFMLRGGDGVISVTNNVAPRLMAQMCVAALAGDRAAAVEINARLDPLHHELFVQSNPIPVKWAVAKLGLSRKGIRLPLTWLTADLQPRVREAMRVAGIP